MAGDGQSDWVEGVGLRTLLVTALALIAAGIIFGTVVSSTATHSPPATTEPAVSEPQCGEESENTVADRILELQQEDQYELARTLYVGALEKDATDQCAADGLLRLNELEAAAEPEPSWAEKADSAWTGWTKDYGHSFKNLAPPTVGLLLVLLVLSRMVTSLIVPACTGGIARLHRLGIWVAGLVVCVTSCVLVVVSRSSRLDDAPWVLLVILLLVAVPGTLLLFFRDETARRTRSSDPSFDRGRRRAVTVVLAVAGVQSMMTAALMIWPDLRFGLSSMSTCLALAVIGIALIAFARGSGPGIRIKVTGADGKPDEVRGRAVVASLERLASHAPSGARIAVGTDVADLPESALTSVPSGAWATALFNIIRVAGLGSPWQAELSFSGDQVVATLLRNGQAIEKGSLEIRHDRFPGVAAEERGSGPVKGESEVQTHTTSASDELVLACAAHVLVRLSRVHPELRRGLCGADEWEAVAFYELARRPGLSSARRSKLLEESIERSPAFLLARNLQVQRLPDTDMTERRAVAVRLDELWAEFSTSLNADIGRADSGRPMMLRSVGVPEPGYEATQLRMLFNRAVVWANVALDERLAIPDDQAKAQQAWSAAVDALVLLRQRLSETSNVEVLHELQKDLKRPAAYCAQSLDQAVGRWRSEHIREQRGRLRAHLIDCRSDEFRPQRRFDHYSLACLRAEEGDLAAALRHLRVASASEAIRQYAVTDPSLYRFRQLRANEPGEAPLLLEYKKLVTPEPVSSYLDLPEFAPVAHSLAALGLDGLPDLCRVSELELVAATKVHRSVAHQWRSIATLYVYILSKTAPPDTGTGAPPVTDEELALQLLQLLLALGIRDRSSLARWMQAPTDLLQKLQEKSAKVRLTPVRADTTLKWTDA